MGQNTNVRDYQNRNQENNANAAEITAVVVDKKNFLQKAGDLVTSNPGKTAAVVGGVSLITAYICRAKKTHTWNPLKKAFWAKQAKAVQAPVEEKPAE